MPRYKKHVAIRQKMQYREVNILPSAQKGKITQYIKEIENRQVENIVQSGISAESESAVEEQMQRWRNRERRRLKGQSRLGIGS